MENFEQNTPPQDLADSQLDEGLKMPSTTLSPWRVLGTLTIWAIAGIVVSNLLIVGIGIASGYDLDRMMSVLGGSPKPEDAMFLRISLIMQHLFLFFLPAIMTLRMCYVRDVFKAAALDKRPLSISWVLGIIWVVFSMGFIQYSYEINKALPLPKWMISNEENVKGTLEAIFSLKGISGAIINTLLIGVMPAFSEELLFRGVIQRQLGRILRNDHAQVWITAAIFSAIHFQFQGFLPRMLLGALLGYTLVWSRSLWVPIIIHGVNNGGQVLALYAFNMKPNEIEQLEKTKKLPLAASIFSLIISIGIGMAYYRVHKSKFENEKSR